MILEWPEFEAGLRAVQHDGADDDIRGVL